VPTFVDRGVSRDQRGGSPTVVNLSFLDRKTKQNNNKKKKKEERKSQTNSVAFSPQVNYTD
jgi:hypothetical protein